MVQRVLIAAIVVLTIIACSESGDAPDTGTTESTGGVANTGGSAAGGTTGQGGSATDGMRTTEPSGTGGGVTTDGSVAAGGSSARGGAGTGGATNAGGSTAGTGGARTGGTLGSGGAAGTQAAGGSTTNGGARTGGTPGSGGAAGTQAAGGATTNGGAGTGGTSGAGGTTAATTAGKCDATTTPVARHGRLSIKDGKLVNQCGRQVQFTSMSLYDWSQQGRQYYTATAVKNLVDDKKCTTLRIPLIAADYPTQYSRVKTVIDACIANGIYCIPNWHVIGSSNIANAKAFHVQIAKDYGNSPNIIHEPWNEPTTVSWSQIKSYMEEVLAAIRPMAPDALFLAGTRQWDQRPDEACANPINDPLVGYVFHFYANSHSLSNFKGSVDKCLSAKKLVWTTEYGGCASGGSGTLNPSETNKWWDYMDQNLISSNAWAIETNPETSSVFVTTASSTGPWPDSQLTEWGRLVFPHVAKAYPVTMSQ